MPKYSVKKPMTVFVVIVIIIALGVVSLLGMTPDLMPSIDLPYVVVMTTYPGATPKEVETSVTKPLEQGLATVENLKSMQSISGANYSLVIMEFENGTNMDTSVVNILQSTDLIEGSWDEAIGSPYIMKINPNMMPITVAAVDMEGYSTEELSSFVRDTLMSQLEGTTGVASISAGGMVESKINVSINEDKIEALNQKLLSQANASLASARAQVTSGISKINQAEAQLSQAKTELDKAKDGAYDQLASINAEIDAAVAAASALPAQISALEGQKMALEAQLSSGSGDAMELQQQIASLTMQIQALKAASDEAQLKVENLKQAYKEAEKGTYEAQDTFGDSYRELEEAQAQIASQKSQLDSALSQINTAGNAALAKANLGSMITMDTISGILQGQNFSMPAGYIQDDTARYLVSVGDELTTPEDIEGLLLFNVQGIGDVHLSDVADVFVADNSDSVYASINGNPGVMLTFSKQSNYPTATVSGNISDKFDGLSGRYEGLTFTTMMDQGDYIYLIIGAIAESLGYGALFAVIILLLFLRDIKPTLITLLSIPVSIMFAIVLMYFSGVTLNMISLSGLAVAVGMLVDNSIVVIENTFRLRENGRAG